MSLSTSETGFYSFLLSSWCESGTIFFLLALDDTLREPEDREPASCVSLRNCCGGGDSASVSPTPCALCLFPPLLYLFSFSHSFLSSLLLSPSPLTPFLPPYAPLLPSSSATRSPGAPSSAPLAVPLFSSRRQVWPELPATRVLVGQSQQVGTWTAFTRPHRLPCPDLSGVGVRGGIDSI